MSYVGKILVIVQLVLSLLFMAFAGAVFAVHQNWRAKTEAVQKTLDQTQKSLEATQGELTLAKRDFETRLSEAEQKANTFQAKNTSMIAELAALKAQKDNLEQQRATQTGLAEAKANEARFRQEEAERTRIENTKLQTTLDQTAAETRELKDKMFTLEEAYKALNKQYEAGLAQLAYLKKIVANHGLETDPEVVAKQSAPPPPVDGIVTGVRKNRANRVQLIEISIGSDDGLVKGNELDVVRIVGQDNSQWLGRVRVVDLGPDWAVAEVILPSKNGIIQDGDNVTTRLGI
jgi:hypothetical protein